MFPIENIDARLLRLHFTLNRDYQFRELFFPSQYRKWFYPVTCITALGIYLGLQNIILVT